ncbi:intermembrane lipid transfer protein VPS13D isoform X2 [Nematostella vectensis]|uniref:intermembrane lipid transfer protein VPS13D isoform X2 n=1 Tax=Nematostella vectensis TaxID=45351 RepID=UPI0020770C7A|nr:intermembrane lipid transfer protein VPS13D isoform X2 [Nematostella vectensis]
MHCPKFLAVGCHGPNRLAVLLLFIVHALVWIQDILTTIVTILINFSIAVVIRWVQVPGLRITAENIGFFTAHGVKIAKNCKSIEEITVGVKWSFSDLRDFSLKSTVKNLMIEADEVDFFFSFTVYWRLKTPITPTEFVNNDLFGNVNKRLFQYIWLQGSNGKVAILHRNKEERYASEDYRQLVSTAILFEINTASAVIIPTQDGVLLKGRADKLMCRCRPWNRMTKVSDKLVDMSCLKVNFFWPYHGTHTYTAVCHGTQAYITQMNIQDLIGVIEQFIDNLTDEEESCSSYDQYEADIIEQLTQVDVRLENLLVSMAAGVFPQLAVLKLSTCFKAQNWPGKSCYSCSLGAQVVCLSAENAAEPCFLLGNEFISTAWRCFITSTHVVNRCWILSCESDDVISLIFRPDCFGAFSIFQKEYGFLASKTRSSSLPNLLGVVKRSIMEHYPRTQISFSVEGLSVTLEMGLDDQILVFSLEDLQAQCTDDAQNLSLDITVKDIEIEDCTQNVIALRRTCAEDVPQRAIHMTMVQDASRTNKSVIFQQLYGEFGDVEVRLEEILLMRLLVFCGITNKEQLWGEENEPSTLNQFTSEMDVTPLYFERLDVSQFQVIFTSSPDAVLPDDLLILKSKLAVPNGFPPCMERANLEFERFVRTGIQYRSGDALIRDIRRHYMKEIGRQSTKILGSLHLLGNMTGLRDDIAEGLAELRETGNYMGFVRHVKSGLADSYYKLTDSWTPIVKPPAPPKPEPTVQTPPQAAQTGDISRQDKKKSGLISKLTSGLGSWIFSSLDDNEEDTSHQVPSDPVECTTSPAITLHTEPVTHSTPRRDLSNARSVTGEWNGETDDTSSVSSGMTSPSHWDLMPQEVQKRFKGQEFVRRLTTSLDQVDSDEKFLCCLRLRFADPDDKRNTLLTTKRVYVMKVGSACKENVVLSLKLHELYKTQHKEIEGTYYLELVKRIAGMQHHNLPSPHPEDNPLVRCDSQTLAIKAAEKINKAKKKYSGLRSCASCKSLASLS